MSRLIKFPKIGQWRETVQQIVRQYTYTGNEVINDLEVPTYDSSLNLPTITFTPTVKLHGSNGGVSFNTQDGLWVQSRERVLPIHNDNYGFCNYIEQNKTLYINLLLNICDYYNYSPDIYTVSIFGEWCGQGISKNVGISKLPKSFFVFAIKFTQTNLVHLPDDQYTDALGVWIDRKDLEPLDLDARKLPPNLHFIFEFPQPSLTIDFNNTLHYTELLEKLTLEIDRQCPIANALFPNEPDLIGEGLVWKATYGGKTYMFKTKGESHCKPNPDKQTSKVHIDLEPQMLEDISAFVTYSVNDSRFNQGLQQIFNANSIDIRQLGMLIKWICEDIFTEEKDVIVKSQLDCKVLSPYLTKEIKRRFFELPVV